MRKAHKTLKTPGPTANRRSNKRSASLGRNRRGGVRDLERILRRVSRRRAAGALLAGLLLSAAAMGLSAAALFAADRLTLFPPPLRLACGLAFLAGAGWILYSRVARPAAAEGAPQAAASALEKRLPALDGFVLSAAELRLSPTGRSSAPSESLADRTVGEAVCRLETIPPGTAAPLAPPARLVFAAALPCILWAVAALVFPGDVRAFLARFARPTARIHYPAKTRIVAVDAPSVLPEGGAFTLEITAAGVLPQQAVVRITAQGARRTIYAERAGERYTASLDNVRHDFSFSLALGDAVTEERPVEVVPRPRVSAIATTLVHPPYTRLEPVVIPGGDLNALEGSRAEVDLRFNKPLSAARALFDDGAALTAWLSEDAMSARFGFDITAPAVYRIVLTDEYGFNNQGTPAYTVRTSADAPPEVAVLRPDRDLTVVPQAVIPLEVEAEDDAGIRVMELAYTVESPAAVPREGRVLLAAPRAERSVRVRYDWDLSALGLQPGDSITWRVAVEDNRPGEPQRSTSDARGMLVVSVARKLAELDRFAAGIQANLQGIERKQAQAARNLEAIVNEGGAP